MRHQKPICNKLQTCWAADPLSIVTKEGADCLSVYKLFIWKHFKNYKMDRNINLFHLGGGNLEKFDLEMIASIKGR